MTDPTCPYSPLSSPRTRLESCGLVGVPLSVLLSSHVASLSAQLHCELLESTGRVSGFSHAPKGSAQLRSAEGPGEGCCLALAVMFLPECWTPGPTKPQLILHKKLDGYKMQTHFGHQPLIVTQVANAEIFQSTFQVFTM